MSISGQSSPGRLKKRSDFLRLQKQGKKWISPTVIVQMAEGGQKDGRIEIRTGFTVTKKLGGAVTRNRIKRRLKAAAAIVLAGKKDARDIVLIGRSATATCTFPALVRDLSWCLKRLEAQP